MRGHFPHLHDESECENKLDRGARNRMSSRHLVTYPLSL